jgi:hypothetical protein
MKKVFIIGMCTILAGIFLLSISCNNSSPDLTAPGEVSNLSKSVGNQQVTLNWTDPDDIDLDHIAITWGTDGPANVNPQTETYTAEGLTNGTEYTFTVKTVDTSGNLSTGQTIKATPTAAVNGNVTVQITNAPNTYYLWAFAYEEDEWNTDMSESVLATQNGEIIDGSAEIVLHEGCDASWQPTGGEWAATVGNTYDLYVYTTEDADGGTTDRQDTFPRQITITGDETVTVDYASMTAYAQENGNLTVSVSGADDHNGESLEIVVVESGNDPSPAAIADGSATISDGTASIIAKIATGAQWTGTGETAYDVYIIIDVDGDSGPAAPNSSDYTTDPIPVTYYQDGDRVMDTVYPADYVVVP